MNISDEAVEVAAQALAPNAFGWKRWPDDYRRRAREMLEAAAPYLLAQVWDDGEAAGQDNAASSQGWNIDHKYNPYRKPTDAD